MHTIFWRKSVLLIRNNDEIVVKEIDGNTILSGIVLLGTRQETLGEVEARDPHVIGNTSLRPLEEPIETLVKIFHVTTESLEGRIRLSKPHVGNLTNLQTVKGSFQYR
jgi:hypothetical protein